MSWWGSSGVKRSRSNDDKGRTEKTLMNPSPTVKQNVINSGGVQVKICVFKTPCPGGVIRC